MSVNIEMNKITVITLAYNNLHLIETAVRSVYEQDIRYLNSVEYIIADDGSQYFDEEYLLSLIKKYDRRDISFKLIVNEKNVGTVKSLNNAISHSSGDIIVPLSADDSFINSHVLQRISDCFKDSDIKIVTGRRRPFSSELKSTKSEYPLPKHITLFKNGNQKKLLKHICVEGNLISGASTYYRKSFLEEFGFFDTSYKLLEDYPFYIKALSNDVLIALMTEATINYREGGISTDKKRKNAALENDFKYLYRQMLNYDFLSVKDKRKIKYLRLLNKNDKLKLKNVLIYLDVLIPFIYNRSVECSFKFLRRKVGLK